MPSGDVRTPAMDQVFCSLKEFRGRPRSGRSGQQLAAELIQLRQFIDLAELEFARVSAEFDAREEYDMWGSVTPIDWIRHNCRMSGHAAAERFCVGQQLSNLPRSAGAVAGGHIGFAHLALIARTADALLESETASFDEGKLLDQAMDSSVGRFRHVCHHIRHAEDRAGFLAEQVKGTEARQLSLSPAEDGLVWIKGVLDSEGGATLRTALEPLARRQGWGDDRTHERRLGDALVELAHHSLDMGLVPQRASQRTHLQVTASLPTLLGLTGAPAAELESSLPISAKTVERVACDCSVTRILLGSDSAVIDVGRAKRVPSGPVRRALNARDGGCAWPGCDRPASWTSAHHLIHWIHGGGTDLPNLALLCYRHHWLVHEGGWKLIRTDDGRLLTIPRLINLSHRARDGTAA